MYDRASHPNLSSRYKLVSPKKVKMKYSKMPKSFAYPISDNSVLIYYNLI